MKFKSEKQSLFDHTSVRNRLLLLYIVWNSWWGYFAVRREKLNLHSDVLIPGTDVCVYVLTFQYCSWMVECLSIPRKTRKYTNKQWKYLVIQQCECVSFCDYFLADSSKLHFYKQNWSEVQRNCLWKLVAFL